MFSRRSRLKAKPNLPPSKRSALSAPTKPPDSVTNGKEETSDTTETTIPTTVDSTVKNNDVLTLTSPKNIETGKEISENVKSSDITIPLPNDSVNTSFSNGPEPPTTTDSTVLTESQEALCVNTTISVNEETLSHRPENTTGSVNASDIKDSSNNFDTGEDTEKCDAGNSEGGILKHILLNKQENYFNTQSLPDKNLSLGNVTSKGINGTETECQRLREDYCKTNKQAPEIEKANKVDAPGRTESNESQQISGGTDVNDLFRQVDSSVGTVVNGRRENAPETTDLESNEPERYLAECAADSQTIEDSRNDKTDKEQLPLSQKNYHPALNRTLKEVNHVKEEMLTSADDTSLDEAGGMCSPTTMVAPPKPNYITEDCAGAKESEDVRGSLKGLTETTSINKENVFSEAASPHRRVIEPNLDHAKGSPVKAAIEPQSPVKMFRNRFTHIMPNLKRTHRMSVSEDEESAGQPGRKVIRRTKDNMVSHSKSPREQSPLKESRMSFPIKKEVPKQQSHWKEGKLKAQNSAAKDPQNLTMRDFIYYNPTSNPMQKKDDETADSPSNSKVLDLDEDEDDPDNIEEEEAMPVPKVTIGPDNQIIIDKSSLVVDSQAIKKAKQMKDTPVIRASPQTYRCKRNRSKDWSFQESQKFFEQLCIHGSDFSIISRSFTAEKRTRSDIMKKFKKEERANAQLVDFVLGHAPKVADKIDTVEAYFAKLATQMKKPPPPPKKGRKKVDVDSCKSQKRKRGSYVPRDKIKESQANLNNINSIKKEEVSEDKLKELHSDMLEGSENLPFGLSDRKDIVNSVPDKNAEEMEYKIVYGRRGTTRSGRQSKPRRLSVEVIEDEKRARGRRPALRDRFTKNSTQLTEHFVLKKIASLQQEIEEYRKKLPNGNGFKNKQDERLFSGVSRPQNTTSGAMQNIASAAFSFPPGTMICVPTPNLNGSSSDPCPMQVFVVNHNTQGPVNNPYVAPTVQAPVSRSVVQQSMVNERTSSPMVLQAVQPTPVERTFRPSDDVAERTSLSDGLCLGSEVTIKEQCGEAEDALVPETLKENLKDVMEEPDSNSLGRPKEDFISSVNSASRYLLELSQQEEEEDYDQPQDLTIDKSATGPPDCSQTTSVTSLEVNGTQCHAKEPDVLPSHTYSVAGIPSNANQDDQYKGEDLRKLSQGETQNQSSIFRDEGTQSDFAYEKC